MGFKLNTAKGEWEMKLWLEAKGTGAGDNEDEDDCSADIQSSKAEIIKHSPAGQLRTLSE